MIESHVSLAMQLRHVHAATAASPAGIIALLAAVVGLAGLLLNSFLRGGDAMPMKRRPLADAPHMVGGLEMKPSAAR